MHSNVDYEPSQDEHRVFCNRDESLSRVPSVSNVALTARSPGPLVSIDEIEFSLPTLDHLDE